MSAEQPAGTTHLGSSNVSGLYASGSSIDAATSGGLSISTDGGASFTNYTDADGLGDNGVVGVYADASNVYAATSGGLSITPLSGPAPSTSAAPGPLPLFGAASAFGFSRRLRRRLQASGALARP